MGLTINLVLAATFTVTVMGDATSILKNINIKRKTEIKQLPKGLQDNVKLTTVSCM